MKLFRMPIRRERSCLGTSGEQRRYFDSINNARARHGIPTLSEYEKAYIAMKWVGKIRG